MNDVVKQMRQRFIAYHPATTKVTGSASAGIVLSYFLFLSYGEPRWFCATKQRTMTDTGIGDWQYRKALSVLKGLGLISIERRGLPSRNHFMIDFALLEELARPFIDEPILDGFQPTSSEDDLPASREYDLPTSQYPDLPELRYPGLPTLKNKKKEEKKGQTLDGEADPTPKSPEDDDVASGFASFWSIYPAKKSKITARRSWKRLTKKQQQAAIAHLSHDPYGDREPKYIPNPSTYLNQQRWEDEPDPQPSPSKANPTRAGGINFGGMV